MRPTLPWSWRSPGGPGRLLPPVASRRLLFPCRKRERTGALLRMPWSRTSSLSLVVLASPRRMLSGWRVAGKVCRRPILYTPTALNSSIGFQLLVPSCFHHSSPPAYFPAVAPPPPSARPVLSAGVGGGSGGGAATIAGVEP